jgi:protein transport protein SEC61 subunit alpha
MPFDLIGHLRPVLELLPTVEPPAIKLNVTKRLHYTFLALCLYLICCCVPLFGNCLVANQDPIHHLRLVTAAQKFTLMEFGVGPIVSGNLVLHFLASLGLIARDTTTPEGVALFNAAGKLAGLCWAAGEAVLAIFSGHYGTAEEVGGYGQFCLLFQLLGAAVVILLLDEVLSNGYGFGSAVSLFVATNVCETILWKLLSPHSYQFGRGTEFEGALIALFSLLMRNRSKLASIKEVMFRTHLPNLAGLGATVIILLTLLSLEEFKTSLTLTPADGRREREVFEMKLFYSSTTPLLIQSVLIGYYCKYSRMFCAHWPHSYPTRLLGVWVSPDETFGDDNSVPVSGIAYFLQAPRSLRQTLTDPIHTLLHLVITVATAGWIARVYAAAGDQSPAEIARAMRARRLTLPGHREDEKALEKKFERYIPVIATLGGMLLSALAFVSEVLGTFGSGTSILVATSILSQMLAEMRKEYKMAGKAFPL